MQTASDYFLRRSIAGFGSILHSLRQFQTGALQRLAHILDLLRLAQAATHPPGTGRKTIQLRVCMQMWR
jgi:hypothetical protein